MSTEIKFVTSEAHEKNAKGETCYQAQLRHNVVLNEKETKEAFAAHSGRRLSEVTYYVDSLSEFIAQAVTEGHRLDFGGFSVGLKIRKGFRSANAPFDPSVNSVSVEITPGKAIREAAKTLRPVNVTDGTKWAIDANFQSAPFESYDRIAADGIRLLSATGYYPQIHENAPDEGLWIEDDEGIRPIPCEILRRDFGNTDYKLTGPLKRGSYWIVIQSRYKNEPALIRIRRRVKVV